MLVESVCTHIQLKANSRITLGLLIGSSTVYLVFILIIIYKPSLGRRYPANIIMLLIVAVSSGAMLSIVCAMYTVQSVMMTLAVTGLCCVVILVFSFNTKYDLSSCPGLVFCLLWGLLVPALLIPIPYSTPLSKVGIE